MFSTSTPSACTPSTAPRRPLSLPAITTTWSPFLIFSMTVCRLDSLEHFGCERDDLHELNVAQLARHGPEDAGADRLELVGQEDRGITVELDQRAVGPAHSAPRAH